jgi:HicB family
MPSTMVQIRNVPPEFHRRLKARAAMEGMSMSEYILREVGKTLERWTICGRWTCSDTRMSRCWIACGHCARI